MHVFIKIIVFTITMGCVEVKPLGLCILVDFYNSINYMLKLRHWYNLQ